MAMMRLFVFVATIALLLLLLLLATMMAVMTAIVVVVVVVAVVVRVRMRRALEIGKTADNAALNAALVRAAQNFEKAVYAPICSRTKRVFLFAVEDAPNLPVFQLFATHQ